MSDRSLALSLLKEVQIKLGASDKKEHLDSEPGVDHGATVAEPNGNIESVAGESRGAMPYIPPPPQPSHALGQTQSQRSSEETELHPLIIQLIQGFLKYLKEPRYQAPLTLDELSKLFQYFYNDLNLLTVNVYTQLNSTKKKLISSSKIFEENGKKFDYLLAISNFLASTVKLIKRTDPEACFQLRIFNYYKFITIFETLEAAQRILLGPSTTSSSTVTSTAGSGASNGPGSSAPIGSSSSSDDESSLYDKIFRFDQKDIIYQEFLDDKLSALKSLELPLTCFVEESDHPLNKLFHSGFDFSIINSLFLRLNNLITPFSKIKQIMKIQKLFIQIIAQYSFNDDTALVNNDILLPALIYYIINYLPYNEVELHLNFTYMKNFLNIIPETLDMSQVPQISSLYSYSPQDKLKKLFSRRGRVGSLFEFLNLSENQPEKEQQQDTETNTAVSAAEEEEDDDEESIFSTNQNTVAYIQSQFLNSGELMYYLTNFEAVLFFLLNITLEELNHLNASDNELLNTSLNKLVDSELLNHFKFPTGEIVQPEEEILEASGINGSGSGGRSRSSSLFNTISNNIKDVTASVNRSRSNSSIINSLKSNTSSTKETFPTIINSLNGGSSNGSGEPDSLQTSPVNSNEQPFTDPSTTSVNSMVMMKNILGRFGQVSVPPPTSSSMTTVVGPSDELVGTRKHANTSPIRSSPQSRTRSSSLEQKRNSITSKFTTGVSEFMTKINNANITTNTSSLSLHSLENHDATSPAGSQGLITESPIRRPDYNRSRTTSLQIMDKWFNNISNMTTSTSGVLHSGGVSGGTPALGKTIELIEPSHFDEIVKFQNIEFESLTINDLKQMKINYDKLCSMVVNPVFRNDEQSSYSEETSM